MFRRVGESILKIVPAEIGDRPFDFFISIFFILIILSAWLNWWPPSVFFFFQSEYSWITIFSKIDMFIGSLIIAISMIINSYRHRCHYRVSVVELIGWWGIFAGSSALVVSAVFFTPQEDMSWPTLVWTINSLAAMIKILSPLEDKIKWIK